MASVEVRTSRKQHFLEITVSGTLTAETYNELDKRVERILQEQAPVRLLFVMSDFHGWTVSGLWKDITFELKHRGEIDRVALVGDRSWQHGLAFLCRPFMAAQLRYFDSDHIDEARAWLGEPVTEDEYGDVPPEIADPLRSLASDDGRARENARHEIAEMGEAAVPALAKAARSAQWQVRWEATKALAEIGGESAIAPLVTLLHEGDDIRWIAAERLKHMGRPAVEQVLRALISDVNSVGLCRGAHHVLNELDDAQLRSLVSPIVAALEQLVPTGAVSVAAYTALQKLRESPDPARSDAIGGTG